jgi:CxxC motif-containing protein (DUF1111 family)
MYRSRDFNLTRRVYSALLRILLVAIAASPAGLLKAETNFELLGGDLTSDLPGRNAIQVTAPNVTDPERRDRQLNGFGIFHQFFSKEQGLGPRFINPACRGCHLENGRGPLKFFRSRFRGSTMVVKLSLKGLNPDGSPRDVPGIGNQLQDHVLQGTRSMRASLEWQFIRRKFPDGTPYTLRKPRLSLRIKGQSTRKLISSLRMSPAIIGPGLLEAISEADILALADPEDANGDGISGKPQYVPDLRMGTLALGRFGFRASQPTLEQQSAAAAFGDMGISNALFPNSDGSSELSDSDLDILVMYQKLAGVPRAARQSEARVAEGRQLFQDIGCASCHSMTFTTGQHPDSELSGQQIIPFTDLLLHDMGPGLADKRAEYNASGSEWRTTPLWGLGFSRRLAGEQAFFLHDGRARSIQEAILWHGGEAKASREKFEQLAKQDRATLLLFLDSL